MKGGMNKMECKILKPCIKIREEKKKKKGYHLYCHGFFKHCPRKSDILYS